MNSLTLRSPAGADATAFQWSDGVGYFPVDPSAQPYDRAYFDRFAEQADTPIGRALMTARVKLVCRHWRGDLVDVGIGSGAFIGRWKMSGWGHAWGYDINPAGIDWLRQHRAWWEIHRQPADAVTMWDVFEHLPDPSAMLRQVRQWCFLSLPIFRDAAHALGSKHFRPDEHYWYFTRDGLMQYMRDHGFRLVEENSAETDLGREDIGSFAFQRRDQCAPEI